ncbi:MAG TPA: YdeI/OmpD-associated family protein [Novosphingobium sp.]|nr:YdeI/OmpD-associated family protein [Novosphingobium sp.]
MPTDPRIDAYIANAQPFARPILEHFRELVHCALPQAEETLKWSMPHFTVGGRNVAGMASFKAHAALMIHGDGRQGEAEGDDEKGGMGHYGRITSLADLPGDAALRKKLIAAADKIASGVKEPRPARAPKPEIATPPDVAAALDANGPAKATFERFAPSHRREYLEWITDAKRAETRERRLAQAIVWLSEGKKRNWKYENC